MGELIQFPSQKPEGDISDTPLGQEIIQDVAKPAFQASVDEAGEQTGFKHGIDLDEGKWAVIPLGDIDL